MSCAFDKEKLTAFFDGELAAAEKAEVERHIAACSECLRELGELKAAVTLVKTLPAVRAPRSIAEAVQREVRPPARLHRWAQPMMWVSAAAAALFVVVNVVWLSQMETGAPLAGKPAEAPKLAVASPGADERRSAANSSAAPEPAVRRAREADAVEKAAAKEEFGKADGASADRKAAEAPAPARKEFAEEPKPAAAAKAPPAPKPEAAPAAPTAPPPGAEAKRDLAQTLQDEQKNRQEPAQSVYLAMGENSLRCQTVVEGWTARNNLQLRGQAQSRVGQGVASGGGGLKSPKVSAGKDAAVPSEPMVVEVTDEELAALTKELAANGYRVSVATPAQNQLGYVELPADAEKKKAGEGERALKAAAPAESGPVAKQQAGRAGARRITIYFVDQQTPPAAEKK